ncbi:MAG: hypothetical protein ACLPSF_08555 [Methylocella sp.]
MSDADEERVRKLRATIASRAREFYRLAARPCAGLGSFSLAICIFGAACSAAKADCRYGDSSKPERSETKLADDELYMCVDGKWIRDKDILAVINVERANLWSDRATTDETDYVKAACDERQQCSLPPTANWAGVELDPKRRKHLWVSYHCAIGPKDLPTTHSARQAEENVPLELSCSDLDRRRAIVVPPGYQR